MKMKTQHVESSGSTEVSASETAPSPAAAEDGPRSAPPGAALRTGGTGRVGARPGRAAERVGFRVAGGCTGSGFASLLRAGRRENGALPARPSPSVREGAPPGRRPRGPRCVVTARRVHGRAGEGCTGTAPCASLRRGPPRRRHPRNRERHTALRGSRHHAPATERTSHFRSDCEGGTLGATP